MFNWIPQKWSPIITFFKCFFKKIIFMLYFVYCLLYFVNCNHTYTHRRTCTRMAVHLPSMHMQILNMVLHKQQFFQCTPHIDLIIVAPQRSGATLTLRNITENVFRTPFPAVLFFSLSSLPSDSSSVPFGAQTNFSFFLFEMVQAA